MNFVLPTTQPRDWYLVTGATKRQWFSDTPLETVLGMAILMTGAGDLSGADEVTVEDNDRHPIVTFVANPGHKGCQMAIPFGSPTTPDDFERLRHFMIAYQMIETESNVGQASTS